MTYYFVSYTHNGVSYYYKGTTILGKSIWTKNDKDIHFFKVDPMFNTLRDIIYNTDLEMEISSFDINNLILHEVELTMTELNQKPLLETFKDYRI